MDPTTEDYKAFCQREFKWLIEAINDLKIVNDAVLIYHRFESDQRFSGQLLLTIEGLALFDLITKEKRLSVLKCLEYASDNGVIQLDFDQHAEQLCQ